MSKMVELKTHTIKYVTVNRFHYVDHSVNWRTNGSFLREIGVQKGL